MTEQPTPAESADTAASSEPAESWGSNGTHVDDAVAAEADASVEAQAEVGTPTAADATESASSNEAPADDGAEFLAALTQAMQATAGAERARVVEDVENRRQAHLAAIHARRETESGRIRELADDDRKTIDSWAETERERIKVEHERRTQVLNQDLETSLAEHSSKIDREIQGVEAAIAAYRAEVETFFTSLEGETDPVAIAQHAGRRPVFPSLEAPASPAPEATGAAEAPADAAGAADAPVEGVMDPSSKARTVEPWPSWNGLSEPPQLAEVPAAVDAVGGGGDSPEAEPVPVAANAPDSDTTPMVQSMPVSRPMSWLRHNRDSSEGGNGEK